jgi:hypothetical protein
VEFKIKKHISKTGFFPVCSVSAECQAHGPLVFDCIHHLVTTACVDVTFYLDPVIFKPKLPSAPYFLNEGRFFIDIWRNIFD